MNKLSRASPNYPAAMNKFAILSGEIPPVRWREQQMEQEKNR